MGKGKQQRNDQRRKHIEQADAEALERCNELVDRILMGVETECERHQGRAWSSCEHVKQYQDLPYKEMIDAINAPVTRKDHLPKATQSLLAAETNCKRKPNTPAAPRTVRAGTRHKQMAPAPTPAVAALNDVGYNVTCVRNFRMEVDLPDGTKRTLTNADFATMNPDDMKGTKLEQLLAEALRLKQSH